jgi:hypothetical protein
MEYNKIISVTGMPGLFELVSSKNDGAIVKSLDDKSTKFVASRKHNFSHLESIEVYTTGDNVNLAEVFEAMGKTTEKLPDEKDPAAIKKYFEKVYKEIDFSRVYNNDMKKMIRWYTILKDNEIEIKLPVEEEEEEAEEVAPVEEEAVQAKAPAAKAKKAAVPKESSKKTKIAEDDAEPVKKGKTPATKKKKAE